MIPAKFEYFGPTSLDEACRYLREKGPEAKVMAGGTDLLLQLRRGRLKTGFVVGLKKIPGLDRIVLARTKGLTIGAMALLSDVAAHPDIQRVYPAVAYAAKITANTQVRNMGTVIGNICNAAPSADNVPTLLAMGARLTIVSSSDKRELPLEHFFKGPGMTVLAPGEIVTEVFVPWPPRYTGVSYQHLSARSQVDISAVCVAAMITLDGQRCKDARIALGAVAPTPIRAKEAEALLRGKKITGALMEKAGSQASHEAKPISDVRASAQYRKRMVAVLTKRALFEAEKEAKRSVPRREKGKRG